jgi:release factor glutamine methyltransferase
VAALRREVAALLESAFRVAGREGTPGLDARLLVAHALGRDPQGLALIGATTVTEAERESALVLARRRMAGEPVARILGRREFWGLDLALSEATLVPRPDTETLVEAALAFVDAAGRREAPLSILDLGTGSGAILLALLTELPQASGLGIDLSGRAVATATANAGILGLAGRARFAACDWAAGVTAHFDLVVSNPPYIESAAIAGLSAEVRDHDPRLALDGGPDGLDAYRAILAALPRLLAEGGGAFLEVGRGQAAAVAQLAAPCGFATRPHVDLAGIERVVELFAPERRGFL